MAFPIAQIVFRSERNLSARRRSSAVVLLAGGVDIRALSEYLGLHDPAFTLRIYAHLMPGADDRARRALEKALAAQQSSVASRATRAQRGSHGGTDLRQARELLSDWADVARSRDDRVRTALESGLSKSEMSRLTGIARSTIDRIVGSGADGSATAQDGVTTP